MPDPEPNWRLLLADLVRECESYEADGTNWDDVWEFVLTGRQALDGGT